MSENNKIKYHIYGRTDYARPLEQIETVEVTDAGDLEIPEGIAWVELIAFPDSAVIQIIPHSEENIL